MNGSQPQLAYLGQVALSARLRVVSGLHIGAGKDAIEIGGIDNPVVKTPEGKPFVPGSSLKGKLRFLLEWAFGNIHYSGKPWGSEDHEFQTDDPVLRIFGTPAKKESWSSGPTRLLMRDAMPHENWLRQAQELTEEKTEVVMDRIAGKAMDRVGARRTERVPPSAEFNFEAAFRLYDVDEDSGRRDLECLAWLIQGLDLLEQDALGGSGSRGYGQIRFCDLTLKFPGRDRVSLDNSFRGHVFSRKAPPSEVMKILDESFAMQRPDQE